jgi:pimeloyl-ACP methyl ester carboxylesterase
LNIIKKSFTIEDEFSHPIIGDFSSSTSLEKAPLVIFCHGYKGYKDWGAWNLVADEFVKKGFSFVKFNFSLNGGTIENPIDFPDLSAFSQNTHSQEVKDVGRLLKFLTTEFSNNFDLFNVSIIGHSRGGGVALLSSAKYSLINKVCTWASVSDYGERFPSDKEIEEWKKNGVRYVLNTRTKQMMPHNYSFYEDYIQNKEELSIKKAVQKLTIPQMIIHGTLDQAVNIKNANSLKKWNSSAEMFSTRTNHTFGIKHPWLSDVLPTEMEIVVEQTISFLKHKI